MNNKKKNILVWIFVWAGLLIAVLYSPIGSPDLYSTKGYFVGNQSVNFKDGVIENAPKGGVFTNDDNNNQINVPDYNNSEDNPPKYAVNSYSTAASTSVSTTSDSYNASQPSVYQNTSGSSSSGSIAGGGSTFISHNSSKSSNASSTVTMSTGGITTLSTDLTSTSSTKQAALSLGGHGTDPGGNPTGPPVPVGDGWIFLLLLAAGYGAWRKKFRVITKTHIEE